VFSLYKVEIYGIHVDKREIKPGVDIVDLLLKKLKEENFELRDGDVIVITSKILSIMMNRIYELKSIKPSFIARFLSKFIKEDPRVLELILNEGDILLAIPVKKLDMLPHPFRKYAVNEKARKNAIKQHPYLFLVKVNYLLLSDAGLDFSNAPPGFCTLPPRNPDKIARMIMENIRKRVGKKVSVVIADTELLIDRFGSRDIAMGCAGISPVTSEFGAPDLYGKPKFGGVDALADAVATAAGLVFGQTRQSIPIAIIRGLKYKESNEGIKDISYIGLDKRIVRLGALLTLLETIKFKFLLVVSKIISKILRK